MADVLDISSCSRLPLDAALSSKERYCRAQLSAGGTAVPNRPALWPIDIPEVGPLHVAGRAATTPEADVFFVREGLIGGPGSALKCEAKYVFGDSAYPLYIRQYMDDDLRPLSWNWEPSRERTVAGDILHISHFNPMYGHWLLEIFPKLFAIKRLNARGISAPILISKSAPAYVRNTIEMVLPGQEII
ncbi:MAG: hypothetical protein WA418_15090, partial [Bradyrhizobium sp.]